MEFMERKLPNEANLRKGPASKFPAYSYLLIYTNQALDTRLYMKHSRY